MSTNKYNVDFSIFDKIDTADKAYFLGLFYADGYNNEKQGRIVIILQENDKKLLEVLSNTFFNNRPLYFLKKPTPKQIKKGNGDMQIINTGAMYCLTISSRNMSNKMKEYGAPHAKSLTIKFPYWLEENLWPHFIRGYFDGDGSCTKTKNRKNGRFDYRIGIISNDDFCKELNNVIGKYMDFQVKSHKHGKMYVSYIGGHRKVQKFLDWIYKDATIFLERKYERYLELQKENKLVKDKITYVQQDKQSGLWYGRLPSKYNRKTLGIGFKTKEEASDSIQQKIKELESVR